MHSNLLITLRAVRPLVHTCSILYTVAKEIALLLMFDVGTHLCLLLDTTFPLIIVGWWHTISWSTHSQDKCQVTVLKPTNSYCTRGYTKAVRGILITSISGYRVYILCSAHFSNMRNFEIALRNL